MASFQIVKNQKFLLNTEFKNFPLTFVNGLRRILLSQIPIVVLRNVEIISNTSQMPYEMLKHRVELLPVNVSPEDTQIIKNASIHLEKTTRDSIEITTDDFTVKDGRDHLLMKDRDLGTPLLFLRLKPNETIHLTAKLALEKGSQVCTASMSYHLDPERVKHERGLWLEKGKDPREFDNFYYQKYYSIDDIGRPNWLDLSIESVGVLTSQEIMKFAIKEYRSMINTWFSQSVDKIAKEGDKTYNIVGLGGHTEGALLQEVMYHTGIQFVSYDIPHPLRPQMVLRFVTDKEPEKFLKEIHETIEEYYQIVEKAL
jgi:DNA-directed RNA polymerase subunit L